MDVSSLIAAMLLSFLPIGVLARAIATRSRRNGGRGLPRTITAGIMGAFVGGFLFGFAPAPLDVGLVGAPIRAAIGAAVALMVSTRSRSIDPKVGINQRLPGRKTAPVPTVTRQVTLWRGWSGLPQWRCGAPVRAMQRKAFPQVP